MRFPRWGHGSAQDSSQEPPGVYLNQHGVALLLRQAAGLYEQQGDVAGSVALHAAANGFDGGHIVPGVGFTMGGIE